MAYSEKVLVRINPESERIGILREVLGDDWYYDCDDCNLGSTNYRKLSSLIHAINLHCLENHGGKWNL